MTVEEFDIALTELETRVDRLRALYENWFRGYEKSEPHVPRKDVERRVYALRKELPRNTALRFRYHQLYLKYTTMANYWQRTARQIEEGTYRPQLERLRRKHERLQERDERNDRRKHERGEEQPAGAPGYELDLDESLDVDDLLNDLEMDEVARAIEVRGPHSEPPPTDRHQRPPPAAKAPASATFSRAKGDDAPAPQPAAPQQAEGPAARAASFPNVPFPNVPTKSAPQLQPGAPGATLPGRPAPMAPAAPVGSAARGASALGSAQGPQTGLTGSLPGLPRGAGPGTGQRPLPAAPQPAPAPAPQASKARAPEAAAPGRPASTVIGRPAPPSPAHNAAPRPGAIPPAQSGSTFVGRAPAASPLAEGNGVPTEQRLRNLYAEYTAARRRNNEAEVRFETLVSSIQKMLPELNKKHRGKQIDFDVVVKDGRVGLKPKAT